VTTQAVLSQMDDKSKDLSVLCFEIRDGDIFA
jgi:hypothetical protein